MKINWHISPQTMAALDILGWNGLGCFGLHLAITNSMKDDDQISCVIGVAHGIIGVCTWLKKEKRLDQGTNKDGSSHHSLVTECTTQGPCYRILDRILEQERTLVQSLGADPKTKEVMESVVSAHF